MTLDPCYLSMLVANGAEPTRLPTLYHGTTLPRAKRILKEGLLPRGVTGVPTVQDATGIDSWLVSDESCVYASTIEGAAHALRSALMLGEPPAVVELVLPEASRRSLLPDEDVLAIGIEARDRPCTELVWGSSDECRQARAKNAMRHLRHLWPASLAVRGSVAHEGAISVGVVRARWLEIDASELMGMTLNETLVSRQDAPTTTAQAIGRNHRTYLEATTRWSMGEEVRPWDAIPEYRRLPMEVRRALRAIFARDWEDVEPAERREEPTCGRIA